MARLVRERKINISEGLWGWTQVIHALRRTTYLLNGCRKVVQEKAVLEAVVKYNTSHLYAWDLFLDHLHPGLSRIIRRYYAALRRDDEITSSYLAEIILWDGSFRSILAEHIIKKDSSGGVDLISEIGNDLIAARKVLKLMIKEDRESEYIEEEMVEKYYRIAKALLESYSDPLAVMRHYAAGSYLNLAILYGALNVYEALKRAAEEVYIGKGPKRRPLIEDLNKIVVPEKRCKSYECGDLYLLMIKDNQAPKKVPLSNLGRHHWEIVPKNAPSFWPFDEDSSDLIKFVRPRVDRALHALELPKNPG